MVLNVAAEGHWLWLWLWFWLSFTPLLQKTDVGLDVFLPLFSEMLEWSSQ
jgi:hypothetical protein